MAPRQGRSSPDDVEATLTVTRGEDVSKGGAVFVNDQMELVDIQEKSPLEGGAPATPAGSQELAPPWYNAGLYPRGVYELTDAIRDLARSGKKVKALELTGEWADVRDPQNPREAKSKLVGRDRLARRC